MLGFDIGEESRTHVVCSVLIIVLKIKTWQRQHRKTWHKPCDHPEASSPRHRQSHRSSRHRQRPSESQHCGRPVVGASAKAAASGEPPQKKPKTEEWHLPEALQDLETRPEQLDQALGLSGALHVLDLGLLEEWLGHGLIVAWSAHTEYPVEAMTMELAELITQIQADPSNSEAANRLNEFQRSILKGLVKWEVAVKAYVKTYRLCVTARKDIRKMYFLLKYSLPRGHVSFPGCNCLTSYRKEGLDHSSGQILRDLSRGHRESNQNSIYPMGQFLHS